MWVSSCGVNLESNEKVIGYSDGIYTTIVPVSFRGRLIVIVAHRVHTWIRLVVTFSSGSLHSIFQNYEN